MCVFVFNLRFLSPEIFGFPFENKKKKIVFYHVTKSFHIEIDKHSREKVEVDISVFNSIEEIHINFFS